MDDLNKYLSFEIKKEIADRYFGFRKSIEAAIEKYYKEVEVIAAQLEKRVEPPLQQILSLLNDETLILSFFTLIEIPKSRFIEKQLLISKKTSGTLFTRQSLRGFTKKSCFKNLFFDTYKEFRNEIFDYHQSIEYLEEEQESINKQLHLFYKKNDITSILQVLKSFENQPHSQFCLIPDTTRNLTPSLDNKMQLSPPPKVEELLPRLPIIPHLKTIRLPLKKLAMQAQTLRPELDIRKEPVVE